MPAGAPYRFSVGGDTYIRYRLGVGMSFKSVFIVAFKCKVDTCRLLEGVGYCIQTSVSAGSEKLCLSAVYGNRNLC